MRETISKTEKGLKKKDYSKEENNNPVIRDNTLPEVFNPEEMFNAENGGTEQNNVKLLFDPKNFKIKSELTKEQIRDATLLYSMSREFYEPLGIFILKDALDEFILLNISKDRASRKEFVDAHRETLKQKTNSFMDNIIGRTQQ